MILHFKNYLHDDEFYEDDLAWCLRDAGHMLPISDEVVAKAVAQRPFYEVALDCTFDTETGNIEIVGVSK